MHSPDTRVQIFYQYLKISSGKCIFVTQLTLLVEAPCCKDCEEETPFHVETVAQRLKCPFIVVTKAAADSRVSVRSSDVFSPDCRQFQPFLPYFAQFRGHSSHILRCFGNLNHFSHISHNFNHFCEIQNRFRRSLLLTPLRVSLSLIHRQLVKSIERAEDKHLSPFS